MSTADMNALERLKARPHDFSLFAALRVLERHFADAPRLGESRKASDDAVRLGQAPHLSFAPSDVVAVSDNDAGQLEVEQYGFGVFGPNGALPLHLTELAYERRRQKDDRTIADFLNVFQHRFISLFYRAWADSEPAVSFDRPDADRFRTYVGALLGLASRSAPHALLSRVGRFAPQARSADGLEALLIDYFDVPVEVRPFAGAWVDIPRDMHCKLGEPQLGLDTTLGATTWQCQHRFEIVLGPLPQAQFNNFLPGAAGLAALHDLVRFYTNDEWDWQVRLLMSDVEVPELRLGRSEQTASSNPLGWTSWLGTRRAGAQDVVIQSTRAASHAFGAGSHG